jgi:carbamoyltransferase
MAILGLGGLLGDAAAAVLQHGEIKAAIEENKLRRGGHPGEVPQAAVAECLRLAGLSRSDIKCVAVARPFARAAESVHMALREQFPQAEIAVVEHHQAHAASAYFASPFESAVVLTLDHAGDFCCGARWRATGTDLVAQKEWYYPDSLGRLYGAVTELLGMRQGAEEHKVQWLSTAGDDRYVAKFASLVTEGVRLNPAYFSSNAVRGSFNAHFLEDLGLHLPLEPEQAAALAHALQVTVAKSVLAMATEAGDSENLCLAGGLFMNVLLVEALERSGRWKNVFVQPAAGNAGTAIGAAYHAWHQLQRQPRRVQPFSLFLGPGANPEEIKQVFENCKLRFQLIRSQDQVLATAVRMLGEHKIVAWMHGRMEFGPRALGNRSIVASPLDPYSSENLNVYIKHREPFRKFAASVPAEFATQYFDVGSNARNLASMGRVRPEHRKTFAAAILGDDQIRAHVVHPTDNPLYHRLLCEAGKATGLPVLYNTSFNLFGDPLVSTPREAVRSFYSSGIDAMFVGNFLLEK